MSTALRLTHEIQTPSGQRYQWSEQQPHPSNVPGGVRFSSTMPGGHETADATLPRRPGVDYSDLERLSTWTIKGAGGEILWQGRLERAPRVSGDQVAVSPSAVGWQAHLEDDKTAVMPYVDADLSHWVGPSTQRQIDWLTAEETIQEASAEADPTTSLPALKFNIDGAATAANDATCESYYDAGAADIGDVYLSWDGIEAAANITFAAGVADDAELTGAITSADLYGTDGANYLSDLISLVPTRFAFMRLRNQVAFAAVRDHVLYARNVRVYGNHGLTLQGDDPGGLLASDVIAHAVGSWAPLLNYSTGSTGSIRPTDFTIPHLAFLDPTTAGEIIRQADRFHLSDWAVWHGPNGPTFYYTERGELGRMWRARVRPAQLEETGPQVDRLWNGVLVRYQDPDGTTRTVGPAGSGADAEDNTLRDTDPLNPANQRGIRRWDLLDVSGVTTQAGAVQIGTRFLTESKLLDSSGRAQLVGFVEDDKGILRPVSQVRAGDSIVFVDASDKSYRRIVRAEYSHDERTTSIDIDAPPEGLDALLERLGVVLVPLGL